MNMKKYQIASLIIFMIRCFVALMRIFWLYRLPIQITLVLI